jgi:hypothetical protein
MMHLAARMKWRVSDGSSAKAPVRIDKLSVARDLKAVVESSRKRPRFESESRTVRLM